MEKTLERLLTDLFKGIIYATLFGIVGLGIGFLLGWPLLKGAYVTILIVGVIVMGIAILLLIGTPKQRFRYFVKGKMIDGRIENLDEPEKKRDFSANGLTPAVVSIVMITIGFMIEALMH